jgi:hypothetical protein
LGDLSRNCEELKAVEQIFCKLIPGNLLHVGPVLALPLLRIIAVRRYETSDFCESGKVDLNVNPKSHFLAA